MNTQQKIKHFLEIHKSATVNQLSVALGLTRADINYHVRKLCNQNELEILPERYQAGAGKPARKFTLVKAAPAQLSSLIYKTLNAHLFSVSNRYPINYDPASIISQGILSELLVITKVEGVSPTIKLNKLIAMLSVYGIQIRWQAGKQGPQLQVVKESLSSIIKDSLVVEQILEILISEIERQIS